MSDGDRFIQDLGPENVFTGGGFEQRGRSLVVWVLAHRGYSGSGRLDLWAYPSEEDACREGAKMALEICDDPEVPQLFAAGEYREVLARYEQESPVSHMLRVEPAYLTEPD